ncbi:MAG: Nramp family divalent metal transporter [Alcanivoracaceae bacterium]|nr:Nramp family divalent metal transporter [Alcanivoracaceae bacterium]
MTYKMVRKHFSHPPEGLARMRWYGPGLLWMLSAVGTGSILFTPRVAAAYQYELLWLLFLVVFFMWVMIREMARFSIVSGCTMLEGMHTLPGPSNWAVWVIFVPQLFAAAIGIAGLSAVVGSAAGAFLPGDRTLYALLTIGLCTLLTTTGRYLFIEKVSRVLAGALLVVTVVAAGVVLPSLPEVSSGLAVSWPSDGELYVIMPWVGTILAGSMGIVWFGYWTATRGYGGGLVGRDKDDEALNESNIESEKGIGDDSGPEFELDRARSWIKVMTRAALLGVAAGALVICSFMVLGAELLAPEGIMPEGADVAEDLTRLYADIWGVAGTWMMLAAIFIALGGSVLANQDGWGRSFADMTLILIRDRRKAESPGLAVGALRWLEARTGWATFERIFLKRVSIILVAGLVPAVIILLFRDPVEVMSVSGIIAAAHTPFIVLTALLVNQTRLPPPLKPGWVTTICMALAGTFYLGFAVVYFHSFFG